MKSIFVITAALWMCFSCAGTHTGNDFVTLENGRFMRDGKPYRFVGANFWYGAILGSAGEGGDRQRLVRELDFMRDMGIDNLRILVGSDGRGGIAARVEPTLQRDPGVYDDQLLDGLDFLMAELARRGMYAVLYLNNSWEWSGGYSQYLQWAGEGDAPIPAIDGYEAFVAYVSRYANNSRAKRLFADYVDFIVTRTNRYTGLRYADDPALMSWQIGNEPRAFGAQNKEAFAQWIAASAAQIKRLDPNHLVSTGSEGKVGTEGDLGLWERIHADPNVDYATIHIWPGNWGWIDRETMREDFANAVEETRAYMGEHAKVALRMRKPLVLEEFGYPRDAYSFDPQSPTTQRDAYYESVFGAVLADIQGGGPFAGCNFWAWGGFAEPASGRDFWQPGDDYTGDPAQEPQGLYSVFARDSSTVAVISHYASLISATGD